MQLTNPGETWTDWLARNPGADPDTQLAALREIIVYAAKTWADSGEITREWADKKLAKLGITTRIGLGNTYELEVTASGTFTMAVSGPDRATAEKKFLDHLASMNRAAISKPQAFSLPTFKSGPADVDPTAPADPSIPTTVDATLALLRETIMLAVVAGPKICVPGANDVLDEFGLAPIPERKRFTVSRPVVADMVTTVEAYDMVSAIRVANWRWDDGKSGFTVAETEPTGADDKVAEVASV